MKRQCDWAGCRNLAVTSDDSYWHCRPHLLEHRRFQAEEQRRVAQAARFRPRTERIATCGTRSGFQRHKRLGEQPCDRCTAMEQEYQRLRQQRRRAS